MGREKVFCSKVLAKLRRKGGFSSVEQVGKSFEKKGVVVFCAVFKCLTDFFSFWEWKRQKHQRTSLKFKHFYEEEVKASKK